MSIRDVARELYHTEKSIGDLEKRLKDQTLKGNERERLEQQLRQACSDRDHLRAMLNAAKDR